MATTGQAPINMQQVSAVPAAYQNDALELARAQRLAQMLSSTPAPEGQMISGRYVAPSWTQSLAQLANAATGAYFSNKAETQQQALAEKLRRGETEAFADFQKIKQGTPAVEGGIYGPDNKITMQTTPDMFGANMELNPQYRRVAPVAGVAPNPQAAYANLYADPRATQRQRDFAWQKMNEGPMKVSPDDVLLDPNTLKPIYQGAGKQPDSIKYAIAIGQLPPDPKNWTPAQAILAQNLVERKGAASATKIDINTANKLGTTIAEGVAKSDLALRESAGTAQRRVDEAETAIKNLDKAIVGIGADWRLTGAKILNAGGANNADKIKASEQLFTQRGNALLSRVRSSGLAGSQGLTEGERKFLTDANMGNLTYDRTSLEGMLRLEQRLAVMDAEAWNQRLGEYDPSIAKSANLKPVKVPTLGGVDVNNPLLQQNTPR
jgi:hypothetical protein